MKQVRVAVVGAKGVPAKSGSERVVEEVCKRISSKYSITIYGYRDYNSRAEWMTDIKLVSLPYFRGKITKPVSYLIFTVLSLLKEKKFDIIHLHNVEAGFILPFLRLRYSKIISTAHGPGHDRTDKWNFYEIIFLKLIERIFLHFSDIVTCVKKDLANDYKKIKPRTFFIPNGVGVNENIDFGWAINFLSQHKLQEGNFILFVAGRFLPTKGPLDLLKAIKQLDLEIPVLFIGEQGYAPEYDKEFNQLLETTPNAMWHTIVTPKNKVLALMKSCRFLVFPSYVEAMSMVLLEAASLGTPVLCSNISENCDVMGRDTIYFEPGNIEELKNKILFAYNNPNVMENYAKKTQKLLLQKQNWEVIASKYESLYDSLVSQR